MRRIVMNTILLVLVAGSVVCANVKHRAPTKDLRSTKSVQIIGSISGGLGFYFAANIGGSLVSSAVLLNGIFQYVPSPQGTSFVVGGRIFPKGTVNKSQSTFTVDKNNQLLTEVSSIGAWHAQGFRHLDSTTVPDPGQMMEETKNEFFFDTCPVDSAIFAFGFTRAPRPSESPAAAVGKFVIIDGGVGSNRDAHGQYEMRTYTASDGSFLIEIEFEHPIRFCPST